MKKLVIIIILIGGSISIQAQTYSIAQQTLSKSSSESKGTSLDRFGQVYIAPPIIRIERIMTKTDTLCKLTYGQVYSSIEGGEPMRQVAEEYTMPNHPIFNNLNLDEDSLMKSYPDYVEWVGFRTNLKGKKNLNEKKNYFIPVFPKGLLPFLMILLLAGIGLLTFKKSSRPIHGQV